MRRLSLIVLALAVQTSVAMAKQVDICVAETEVDDGVRITTTGQVLEISKCADSPKTCLDIESFEGDAEYCLVTVYPKGKIPSTCKVGGTATVTGVARYFMGFNDLHDAKISCR